MALFETIKYRLIKKDGRIEIRQYGDILLASTTSHINGNRDSGFNDVFDYIAGGNAQAKKISMTTPVVSYEEDNKLVTGFYAPSKYTKATLPQPTNAAVFINELPRSFYAIIRFSGAWTSGNFDRYDRILRDYLDKHDLKATSNRLLMRYQPPFIPAIFRRNEIAYRIEFSPDCL